MGQFLTAPFYSKQTNIKISLNPFSFRQRLPNFVSPNWKFHNQYCHNCSIIKNCICMPIYSHYLSIWNIENRENSCIPFHSPWFDKFFKLPVLPTEEGRCVNELRKVLCLLYPFLLYLCIQRWPKTTRKGQKW